MKKMIMVLMMVFGLSAVFAKPVDFENDEYYILADDENVQKDFGELSDKEIITLIVNAFPKKTGKYENKYAGFQIREVDEVAEKYFNYLNLSKDNSQVILVQNLGDGRQLMVRFKIK